MQSAIVTGFCVYRLVHPPIPDGVLFLDSTRHIRHQSYTTFTSFRYRESARITLYLNLRDWFVHEDHKH